MITYCFCSSSSSEPRITRIRPAVPLVATTRMATGRCFSMSMNLATLQGWSRYSDENRPVIGKPNQLSEIHISSRASMKLGVASPMKPSTVAA